MSKYYQRGLSSSQEQRSSALIRDTRSLGQKISQDVFRSPLHASLLLFSIIGLAWILPGGSDLWLILLVVCFLCIFSQRATLPFRMPVRAKCKDYNDRVPGTNKPKMAEGIYFLGNAKDNGEELWFSNEDMRTHVLIFGSTGSGKTEALLSMSYNALLQSSGFIYVDGKGDNSLFAKVFSMLCYMGRLDDLLLINFMTGARDISGPQERRLSNTLNPFSQGSSSMLSNLVVSMMDSSGQGGDGDMWKGRAIAFVEALMKILVAMRDSGHLLLDANIIRNYFGLDRIEAMVLDKAFIRDGQYAVSIEHLPENVLEPLQNYLYNLPGYNKERRGKQVSQVFEQHGFITMQLTRVFSSLADAYGHILRTKLAEVDLRDVVLNRRVLVVLLPALEKSPDELANLGKVIISTLKVMMAAGLGDEVEGTYSDLILRKPTNALTPFLCVLDEYGYYAVKGFAVVPAQARSLGFSVVFAGQDLPAFQKASKEEAASIGANTNIKICMKLEDPQETWEFFNKTAGESFVTQVESYQANAGAVSNAYQDSRSAKVEKRARIDLLDLKEQAQGEMHIFFKSKIVRARTFYANPEPVKELRLNQLLKVELLDDTRLYTLVKGIEDFEIFAKKGEPSVQVESSSLITQVSQYFKQASELSALESASKVLVNIYAQHEEGGGMLSGPIETFTGNALNVFMSVSLSDDKKVILGGASTYETALISKQVLHEQMLYLTQLMGGSEDSASAFSEDFLSDIQASTHYTLPQGSICSAKTLVPLANALIDAIVEKKAHAAKNPEKSDETETER